MYDMHCQLCTIPHHTLLKICKFDLRNCYCRLVRVSLERTPILLSSKFKYLQGYIKGKRRSTCSCKFHSSLSYEMREPRCVNASLENLLYVCQIGKTRSIVDTDFVWSVSAV